MDKLAPVNIKTERGENLSLSIVDIKKYICPEADDKECKFFLELCRARNLNPFIGEAHFIKYGGKAQMIVGKDVFTKRASQHPDFTGLKAGIIIKKQDNSIEERDGSFYIDGLETVVGGWAEVYRKKNEPYKHTVSLHEYIQKTKDGATTKMWSAKVATMIRKVALVQTLREAFPESFGGMYDRAEFGELDKNQKIEKIEHENFDGYIIQNGEYKGKTIKDISDTKYLNIVIEHPMTPEGLANVCKVRKLEVEQTG